METVAGEAYLGLKIFRFYYRCTNCAAEFCMKTDPKSTDYIMEQVRIAERGRDGEEGAARAGCMCVCQQGDRCGGRQDTGRTGSGR